MDISQKIIIFAYGNHYTFTTMEILLILGFCGLLKKLYQPEKTKKDAKKKKRQRKSRSWWSGTSYSEYEQWCRDHGQQP